MADDVDTYGPIEVADGRLDDGDQRPDQRAVYEGEQRGR